MENVNPELYDFLKENKTGLYSEWRLQEVKAYVHIHFDDLSDFVKIVGRGRFDECGDDVIMFAETICIEINDIINGFDHSLLDYQDCFDKDSWKEHEEEIIKEREV